MKINKILIIKQVISEVGLELASDGASGISPIDH
jgi:hypothetical protein